MIEQQIIEQFETYFIYRFNGGRDELMQHMAGKGLSFNCFTNPQGTYVVVSQQVTDERLTPVVAG
jgi:hypothetical protein